MAHKNRADFPAPMVSRSNFEPYESPVGEAGRMIYTRKERERDLAEHNCVDTADIPSKGKAKNARK